MRKAAAALVSIVVGLTLAVGPAEAAQLDTALASRPGAYGTKGNGVSALSPFMRTMSADGRYVAFASAATNLDPADTDTTSDIYVRDVVAKTTTLVSRATGASGAKANGASVDGAISADGRFVTFLSQATNLDPADADTTPDVFIRDLVGQTTTLVSRATGVSGAKANAPCQSAAVSEDGKLVAFSSGANNLDPADPDGTYDVFVRNLAIDSTTLVSKSTLGTHGNGTSVDVAISAGGTVVTFTTAANNLLSDPDTNGYPDVVARDLGAGTTVLVGRATGATGSQGNFGSGGSSVSADGRFVSFDSPSINLDPADTLFDYDTYVRDLQANTTTLASRVSGASGVKGNSDSLRSSISADGRYVAFRSDATNLAAGDANGKKDVFVRDLVGNTTTLVSAASGSAATFGDGDSLEPSISADGRFVAFQSQATNLDPADTDATDDVFVRDVRGPQAPPSLSITDVRKKEGNKNLTVFTFTVTLDGVPGHTVTSEFGTKNGTATIANNDYQFTNGTLTFPPGTTTRTVTVNVVGDKKKERNETFLVKLFNSNVGIEDGTGVGTIINDDR